MMTKLILAAALMIPVGVSAVAYNNSDDAVRSDCPGKVKCPLSGEMVCKDKCPLVDANRADCPGKIECPLTGELVCKDRCPLAAAKDKTGVSEEEVTPPIADSELPPCCRNRLKAK